MFKDEILESEQRRKIYAAIEASPGIHLREVQRILDMPLTTLQYHLSYMTRRKILFAETEGHHKRYYTKPLDLEDKKVLTALRQKKMREIVLTVLANGKAKNQLLAERLKMSHSTLSSYLKYLVNRNILARERIGYEYLYTVRDEDRVARVLTAYKRSFLDKLVDSVLDTWMETHIRKIESRPRAPEHGNARAVKVSDEPIEILNRLPRDRATFSSRYLVVCSLFAWTKRRE